MVWGRIVAVAGSLEEGLEGADLILESMGADDELSADSRTIIFPLSLVAQIHSLILDGEEAGGEVGDGNV